ncbi:hypothetical protein [Thalassotalea sp. PLHSN55]|uniref:hypothetical protein n=1 Tax=Thalassotalea sp. PLHSN55 TaxID=3435888 RepID=UPI003F858D98
MNKSIIALALSASLAACGGSSDTPPPVEPPVVEPPAPVETIVNGKAVKGTLANAVVKVFKFVDGEPVELTADELADSDITTDGDGNYSFTLLDYTGPVKIELSAGTDTTMVCDAADGCGDVAFGETLNISSADPSFTLSAISVVEEGSDGDVKMNVSALTHLAAALIEEAETGVTAESVQEQSSLVANTFGISGSLTDLEPTVVDDAAAVAGEDNPDELRYGLINAGIMSAIFSGEDATDSVLSTKLTTIAQDLVANEGKVLVSQDADDDFELALGDVLEAASETAAQVAEEIAADETLTAEIDLAQEETKLENEKIAEEALVGEDGFSDVGVDTPTVGDAVAKAAAMVEDVRLFTHLFDLDTEQGAGIETQGDEYVALMQAAGDMVAEEADSFVLLTEISEALSVITMGLDDEIIEGTEFQAADYINSDLEVTGTFRLDPDDLVFAVDVTTSAQGEEVESAQFEASITIAEDGLSIALNLDGKIESTGASFTLADDSKAVIILDSAATRDGIEDDSYDGEIVGGELKLSIELAQKATETVTNPITFSGSLHTELLLVGERVLDEQESVSYDEFENPQYDYHYGKTRIEDTILPEMLSLSGEFSALEGDLIKATLTVNIDELAEYQAPDFEYLGREVADIMNIEISEGLNTVVITEADSVIDYQQSTETRIFTPTPGGQVGEWTATSTVVAANAEEHHWETGIERKIFSRRFSVADVNEQGLIYTRAFVVGDGEFGVRVIRFTPMDTDGDNSANYYDVEQLHTYDDMAYDGTSISTLVNADGDLLLADGTLHTWDNAWFMGSYQSVDSFMTSNDHEFYYKPIANPLTVSNGAELLAQTIDNWWENEGNLTVEDIGEVTFFFDEDDLEIIASGEVLSINPTGYITKALLAEAYTISVSEDSNTVTLNEPAGNSRVYSMDFTSTGNFTFTRERFEDTDINHSDVREYSTNDLGLDTPEVVILRTNTYDGMSHYSQIRITPVDSNGDGASDFINQTRVWGDYINADGIITDENGTETSEGDAYFYANSYDELPFGWHTPFNPLTVNNALVAYQGWLANARGSEIYTYVDDIGLVETNLSSEEVAALTANTSTMFDGYNTEADSLDILENAENFLDINAALTLEAVLGDYEVKVQLAGDRTGLEDGEFELEMVYKLPGDEAQRSFTVHANTEEEDTVLVTNSEDVTVTLMELSEEDQASGESVIGTIVVGTGDDAEQAAQIVDRDGLILVVYSDGTVESL